MLSGYLYGTLGDDLGNTYDLERVGRVESTAITIPRGFLFAIDNGVGSVDFYEAISDITAWRGSIVLHSRPAQYEIINVDGLYTAAMSFPL